ncbi:MAG: YkgJ family cysteine cluster protein, partial [Pirellulaceae bacterium]
MAEQPWYKDGLRFKCTQCGDCCTGAPGYVWVNKAEIEALAAERGEPDVETFESEYVRKIGIRRSLREFPNGDCVFFDSEKRKCTVYNARPRQCRTWPFWDSNLKSP